MRKIHRPPQQGLFDEPLRTGPLTVAQICAIAYPFIHAALNSHRNWWTESTFLRELERSGVVERVHAPGR